MTTEKQRKIIEKMMKKCPEVLTPMKAAKWAPIGKNKIYAAIQNHTLEAYVYKGGYIFSKDALIDYLVNTADEKGRVFATAEMIHDDE